MSLGWGGFGRSKDEWRGYVLVVIWMGTMEKIKHSLFCNVMYWHQGKISFTNLKRVSKNLGQILTDDELREMIEEADRNRKTQHTSIGFLFFLEREVSTQCCLRIGFHSFYGAFQKTCVQVLVLSEISLTKISNCLSNCYVTYNPSYVWWFCTEDGFVDKEEFYKIMKKTTLF